MKAKKSLGQHFLTCQWAVDTLIHAARLTPDDTVLEIGPGTGVLTRALAARVKKVIAVEKDEYLATHNLKPEALPPNVEIIIGDILKVLPDLRSVFQDSCFKIVANIPYYLTSYLLREILERGPRPALAVLTIQKEVAQRITAKPPDMNLLALSVQAYGTPEIIKTVPAECFSPKPKVDSAIIAISDISDEFFRKNRLQAEQFFRVIRAAFSQKRKQLANSLASAAGNKETALEILRAAGINPASRAEGLSLSDWSSIALLAQEYPREEKKG